MLLRRGTTHALVPAGFFVLRTPLFPFEVFSRWSQGLQAHPARGEAPADLAEALEADREMLRARLRDIVAHPLVRQALFLASPSLDESLKRWLAEPDTKRGRKVESVLVRYLARMTGRATPFGLFAGCSVGRIGDATRLRIESEQAYRSHTRLDMEYLCGLADALSRDASIRERLDFLANDGLYSIAGRLRYAESRTDSPEGARSYRLAELEPSPHLQATLKRAQDGASLPRLAQALCLDDPGISPEEARQFIDEMIDYQVLHSALEPPVTGKQPLEHMLDALEMATGQDSGAFGSLQEAKRELEAFDGEGLGIEPKRYRALAAKLKRIPAPADLSRLFHVDLHKPAPAATLGGRALQELTRGVELMRRICPPRALDELTRFRDEFVRRYGTREVPLMEALDEEAGIGFDSPAPHEADSSPLVSDLPLSGEEDPEISWDHRQRLIFRKLCNTLRSGAQTLELSAEDVEQLERNDAPPLPSAFAVHVSLAAKSEAALARGDFRILWSGAFGPSGAPYMGRFCHGDPTLRARVKAHLAREEATRPDAIFAEIVHLPHGRVGNVLCRPRLRTYEIAYRGRSGNDSNTRIPVSDLRVSVLGDRVILRSLRLDREVIPRLTSAHNGSTADLGVYRFLTALQTQGVAHTLRWDWGALQDAPFLPRVASGRLILSRARWRLDATDLAPLATADATRRFRALQELRAQRELPRWVAVVEADRLLALDLDNVLCAEVLAGLSHGASTLNLTEVFPAPEDLCVHGPEGRFVHELVIPFTRRVDVDAQRAAGAERSRDTVVSAASKTREVTRVFAPGSEWLYAKLYTGVARADAVLQEVITPLVEQAEAAGVVDRWFFIRYADPDSHLRIRFHGAPERLQGEILPALQNAVEPMMRAGIVRRFQLDTYEREIERYGGDPGIEIAEDLFHRDSQFVLRLLPSLSDDAGELRWRVALASIHHMMADLGLDLERRCDSLAWWRDGLTDEFGSPREFHHELGKKYRAVCSELTTLIEWTCVEEHALAGLTGIFAERSSHLQRIRKALESRALPGALSQPLESIVMSFVHMTANRLFPSAARAHELVLYNFLIRLYTSELARARARDALR